MTMQEKGVQCDKVAHYYCWWVVFQFQQSSLQPYWKHYALLVQVRIIPKNWPSLEIHGVSQADTYKYMTYKFTLIPFKPDLIAKNFDQSDCAIRETDILNPPSSE